MCNQLSKASCSSQDWVLKVNGKITSKSETTLRFPLILIFLVLFPSWIFYALMHDIMTWHHNLKKNINKQWYSQYCDNICVDISAVIGGVVGGGTCAVLVAVGVIIAIVVIFKGKNKSFSKGLLN